MKVFFFLWKWARVHKPELKTRWTEWNSFLIPSRARRMMIHRYVGVGNTPTTNWFHNRNFEFLLLYWLINFHIFNVIWFRSHGWARINFLHFIKKMKIKKRNVEMKIARWISNWTIFIVRNGENKWKIYFEAHFKMHFVYH